MRRFKKALLFSFVAVAVIAALTVSMFVVDPSFAQSTTKALATNFTLVNFGSTTATVSIAYVKTSGAAWPADAGNTNFTIGPNGGQKIVRQYTDATLTSGQGSAIVSSDQQLGAVTQILSVYPGGPAQVPSSGAYIGTSTPADKWLVPLALKNNPGASGNSNSQIFIQNAGSSSVNVQVAFSNGFTKSGISIPAGASNYYDLNLEAGLPSPFVGSAVVSSSPAGGQLVVVTALWAGADALSTFNAFPASAANTTWVVPLFLAKLPNGTNTPVTAQNVSGGTMAAGNLTLFCKKDPSSSGPATFTLNNTTSIANNASYAWNPVPAGWAGPSAWTGACRVTSASGNIVVFVQQRIVGMPVADADSYQAIPVGSSDKTVFVPLISKRLANNFATVATIVNMSNVATATVTLNYTGSGASAGVNFSTSKDIGPGNSLIQNQRLSGFSVGASVMPDGWQGTLKVTSNQPINGYVQLTNIDPNHTGDIFMTHNVFTQP